MFSDRFRFWKMSSLALVLLLLGTHSVREGLRRFPEIQVQREGVRDPHGEPVNLPLAQVRQAMGEGRFLLVVTYGELIELRSPEADFRKGQIVSVSGRLLPQGYVEAESYTVHRWRWLKKLVSLAAALLILGLCGVRYRLSWRPLTLRERNSCRIC